MRKWINTSHCLSKLHCHACRNNAKWRAKMAESFIMPENCPYPGKWKIPTIAEDLCDACDGLNCPNNSFCCGGKRILTIRVPCPRNLWSMVKE